MLISTLLKLLTNVVLFLLLARVWGPETFGIFMYPFTLAALVVIIVDYGFNLQVVRDVGEEPTRVHEIISHALIIKFFLALLVIAAAVLLIPNLQALEEYRLILFLLLGASLLNSVALLLNLSFRGLGLFHKEAKVTFLSNIVTFTIVGTLVLLGYGPTKAAFGLLISRAVFCILSWHEYRSIVTNVKFIVPPLKIIFSDFRIGFPFAVHVILGTLYFQVDTIIVQHFLGAESVGVYQAGLRILIAGLILTDVLSNVYLTRMAGDRYDKGALVRLSTRMTRHCLAIGVIGFVCMSNGSEWIVTLLYGDEYRLTGKLLPFFGLVLMLRYFGASYGLLLTVADRQIVRMIGVAMAFIISVTLNIILIPMFSLYGALITSIITHIFLTIIYVVFAWRQVDSLLLEWRSYALILTGIAIGTISLFLSPDQDLLRIGFILITGLIVMAFGLTLNEWSVVLKRFSVRVSSTT